MSSHDQRRSIEAAPSVTQKPIHDDKQHRLSRKPNLVLPDDVAVLMVGLTGGGKRDRTDDLLLAKQALSQLSYAPVQRETSRARSPADNLMLIGKGCEDGGLVQTAAIKDLTVRP